ncbi:MAG: sigma-70 family RNA polymerase sigma factor [Verrucomicrobia bacterium]|nr:sigma-70 family RNA polymerase sigma factor [Verrucomicrobiota bacterium]
MTDLFDPTSWSKIRRAAHGGSPDQKEALNLLAEVYRGPLLKLARLIGIPENDAEDEVQSVLAGVLAPNRLAAMDRGKGRFSHYLATSLKRRWLGHVRAANRQRRDSRLTVSLSDASLESIAGKSEDWSHAIDRALGEQCLAKVRHAMVGEAADPVLAERLWTDLLRLDPPGEGENREPMSDAYRQRLRVFRRDFRQHFREVVSAGLTDPTDLEAECAHLLRLALQGRNE